MGDGVALHPTWEQSLKQMFRRDFRSCIALQQCVTGIPDVSLHRTLRTVQLELSERISQARTLRPSIRRTIDLGFQRHPPRSRIPQRGPRASWTPHAPLRTDPTESAFSESREDGEAVAIAKAWQATLFDAGWACLSWPKEFGGRGAAPIERVIWSQEVGRYVTPDGFFVIGQGMCGPTLMAYANEEQKRHYLPALARGDDIWCQLFSEPVAGSDLAGIKTRAERVGDEWVLNGQKIWTSGAHYSDFGIIVTRTDPNVPKHKGLTMFFIDMKSPGIEIRPIKQINGDRAFNEVFFTDVRVPDAQRLGAVGQGWQVSLGHADERAPRGGRQPRNQCRSDDRTRQCDEDRRQTGDRERSRTGKTRNVVRAARGSQIHRLSHGVSAFARRHARP